MPPLRRTGLPRPGRRWQRAAAAEMFARLHSRGATRPHRRRRVTLAAALVALTVLAPVLRAQFTDFMAMDLENLSYVRITTLGRTEHTVVDYPAASTVLTREDIIGSGATTLPETLRDVPGLQVGRIDAFNYAISVRGFNDNSANKLLVMADGRSLHDGTFSGTNWGLHEMILGDLDRIEVLRGPGASLWGANAMNGFINIVSKTAQDTLGSHVALAAGEHLDAMAEVRHGWQVSSRTAARVYAKLQHQSTLPPTTQVPGTSDWRTWLAGSRIDHQVDADRRLTIIAEWRKLETTAQNTRPELTPPYRSTFPEPREARLGNLSARWTQPLAFLEGDLEVVASVDHLDDQRETLDERRSTATLDLQARLIPWDGHELLTGLTYRQTDDKLSSTGIFTFTDPAASVVFFGGFVQDEFDLVPDRLRAIVGAKLERNSYSGWEFQPSARVIWAPHPQHRLWAAASLAARTPSRAETSVDYYAFVLPATPPAVPLPTTITLLGDPDFSTEHLKAFELGYRFVPHPRLQLELSLFYNRYDDVRGFTEGTVTPHLVAPIPHLDATVLTNNSIVGNTHGGELTLHWDATPDFLIEASYSRLDTHLHAIAGTDPDLARFALDLYTLTSPRDVSRLRVAWELRPDLRLDTSLQHQSSLEDGRIPAYTALHAQVAWQVRDNLELALVGRDLLDARHREYPEPFARDVTPNLPRSLFLRVTFSH